jgi:hypothetical protein
MRIFAYELRGKKEDAPFAIVAAGVWRAICGGAFSHGRSNPFHGPIKAPDDQHDEQQRNKKPNVAENKNNKCGNDLGCKPKAEHESHRRLLARRLTGI